MPKLALVEILPKYNVPIFADTSPVLAIYNAPPIPAPPVTTRAPVVVSVLTVLAPAIMLPCTNSVVVITSRYSYDTLLTIKFPPTNKLPAIPTPPATTRAPVVVESDSVDEITTRLLLELVPIFVLA